MTSSTNERGWQRESWREWAPVLSAAVLGLAVVAAGAFAVPALAQEFPAAWIEGAKVWRAGGCGDCHGKYADGEPAVNEMPPGPNLRETSLTREEIAEVIRCGRPGTPMPFNDPGAYIETACYGIPLGEVLAASGKDLTPEKIDNLATYIAEAVKDAGPPDREACAIYYGGDRNYPLCLLFR